MEEKYTTIEFTRYNDLCAYANSRNKELVRWKTGDTDWHTTHELALAVQYEWFEGGKTVTLYVRDNEEQDLVLNKDGEFKGFDKMLSDLKQYGMCFCKVAGVYRLAIGIHTNPFGECWLKTYTEFDVRSLTGSDIKSFYFNEENKDDYLSLALEEVLAQAYKAEWYIPSWKRA